MYRPSELAYGTDALQRVDVYMPAKSNGVVIFMVHGGGWWRGDKRDPNVWKNKVQHYCDLGYIVICVNYRLQSDTNGLTIDHQAQDIADALAFCQRTYRKQFVLMGHSAGGHLVTVISTNKTYIKKAGASGWLGTINLDSAAYNVVDIMDGHHPQLYDDAFGNVESLWTKWSPYQQLTRKHAPFLCVVSSQRSEEGDQAHAEEFADKATKFRGKADVYLVDLPHGEVSSALGLESEYTTFMDEYLKGLVKAA